MSWNARSLMADAKFYNDYSRFDEDLGRYETWEESVRRVMTMHREFFKDVMTSELDSYLVEVEQVYCDKKVLGAQRALQFGGKQLFSHMARMYNCAASYCDRADFFGEAFYLMLCGTGVGFSVQKHHVAKLPNITARTKQTKEFIIPDSIEGWAQAVDVLLSSFFGSDAKYPEYVGRKVYFDYSQIRPKGAFISGGFKAPGPDGLQQALTKIELLIKQEINNGSNKLRPIVAYDILMHIADAVISGGVRRSATICIFSKDDQEMMTAKTGSWFVDNPQRGRSNNSAALLRSKTTFEEFQETMTSVKEFGEPAFIWMEDLEALFNPCVEIGQYGYTEDGRSGWQMCNLTEINGGLSSTPEAFYEQCKYASILGTLQAAYTSFKVLGEASKEIIEREALIGVSVTGWMNNPDVLFDTEVMTHGAEIVKQWNKKIADMIGINQAARTTCVKPSIQAA